MVECLYNQLPFINESDKCMHEYFFSSTCIGKANLLKLPHGSHVVLELVQAPEC